jgi:hypothetical protein
VVAAATLLCMMFRRRRSTHSSGACNRPAGNSRGRGSSGWVGARQGG